MSDDRRKSPRYPADAVVEIGSEDGSASGRLRDICREAVLVESPRTWPLGTEVTVTLDLGAGTPLGVSGTVIRLDQADSPGMAILFSNLPPAVATAIDLYIARQA